MTKIQLIKIKLTHIANVARMPNIAHHSSTKVLNFILDNIFIVSFAFIVFAFIALICYDIYFYFPMLVPIPLPVTPITFPIHPSIANYYHASKTIYNKKAVLKWLKK